MCDAGFVGRLLKRIALGIIAAVCLVYAGDYLLLRAHLPGSVGTVQVQPYYAVPQKDGKTEFILADPESVSCVHSLFPHMGDQPCWYLSGKKQQRINM